MKDKIEEAEVLFTTFADGNFEKLKDISSYPNFCPMDPQSLNLLLCLVWSESVISPYYSSLVSLLGSYRP